MSDVPFCLGLLPDYQILTPSRQERRKRKPPPITPWDPWPPLRRRTRLWLTRGIPALTACPWALQRVRAISCTYIISTMEGRQNLVSLQDLRPSQSSLEPSWFLERRGLHPSPPSRCPAGLPSSEHNGYRGSAEHSRNVMDLHTDNTYRCDPLRQRTAAGHDPRLDSGDIWMDGVSMALIMTVTQPTRIRLTRPPFGRHGKDTEPMRCPSRTIVPPWLSPVDVFGDCRVVPNAHIGTHHGLSDSDPKPLEDCLRTIRPVFSPQSWSVSSNRRVPVNVLLSSYLGEMPSSAKPRSFPMAEAASPFSFPSFSWPFGCPSSSLLLKGRKRKWILRGIPLPSRLPSPPANHIQGNRRDGTIILGSATRVVERDKESFPSFSLLVFFLFATSMGTSTAAAVSLVEALKSSRQPKGMPIFASTKKLIWDRSLLGGSAEPNTHRRVFMLPCIICLRGMCLQLLDLLFQRINTFLEEVIFCFQAGSGG